MVRVKHIGEFRYRVEVDGSESVMLNDIAAASSFTKEGVIKLLLIGCLCEDDKNILLKRSQDELAGQG